MRSVMMAGGAAAALLFALPAAAQVTAPGQGPTPPTQPSPTGEQTSTVPSSTVPAPTAPPMTAPETATTAPDAATTTPSTTTTAPSSATTTTTPYRGMTSSSELSAGTKINGASGAAVGEVVKVEKGADGKSWVTLRTTAGATKKLPGDAFTWNNGVASTTWTDAQINAAEAADKPKK